MNACELRCCKVRADTLLGCLCLCTDITIPRLPAPVNTKFYEGYEGRRTPEEPSAHACMASVSPAFLLFLLCV